MRRPGRGKSPRGGAAKRAAKAGAPALRPLSASEEADLAYRKQLADQRQSQGDVEGALQALEGATPAQASRPEFRARKATLLGQRTLDQASLAEAERLFRRLAAEGVNSPQISVNFANVLALRGKKEAAEQELKAAIAHRPDLDSAHVELIKLHNSRGDFAGAMTCLKAACELVPDKEALERRFFQLCLGVGDYQTGWSGFMSSRRAGGGMRVPDCVPPDLPEWDPGADASEPVLLWKEQGVGEQILFGSLAPTFAAGGGRIGAMVDARLVPLLRRSWTGVEVLPDTEEGRAAAAGYRRQAPMAALAPTLRPSAASFPNPPAPFLRPDPLRQKQMADWLGSLGPGRKIGVSWRSSVSATSGRKTMPIEAWEPVLSSEGVRFVDLQYGPTEQDREDAFERFGVPITSHPTLDRMDDFEGVAALIDSLDLVVTVSNTVAHLSGGVGKKTLLMLDGLHFWYWGYGEGSRCPWYADIEAFRREDASDDPEGWAPVARAVRRRIEALVSAAGRPESR